MLRRHLRRGGAPVSACAGFDPDRASAYLEGGLGGSARGRYEAHLAGCPACRRHVIELSRLSQLALQPEAMPAVPARWPRWRSSLAERMDHWVDPSSWRLNWPVASTVLAGCAVLALAMIARPWRQPMVSNSRVSMATPTRSTDSSAALPAPSPTPTIEIQEYNYSMFADGKSAEPQSLRAASTAARSSAEHPQEDRVFALSKPEPDIPKPRIVISPNNKSNDAEKMEFAPQGAAVVGAFDGIGMSARNDRVLRDKQEQRAPSELELGSPPPATARKRARQGAVAEFFPSARRITPAPVADAIAENRRPMRDAQLPTSTAIPRMTPNPEYNPMQSGLLEKEIPRAKNEKSSLQSQKASIWAYVMDYMKGYLPWRRTENFERSFERYLVIGKDARKDSDNKANENNANNEKNENKDSGVGKADKALIRHLRGKTFRFVRGVWIDDQYDAEMSAWRLTSLRRGSEAYNRVLADEPQLKEFFDFGPIIIVWQDKIYRVTGK
jgi:Putative zinc-finger